MQSRRIVAAGLLLLAVGVAATAFLGPLVTDTINYRFSENMENQTTGGDAVLLFIVAPAALIASYLWLRGRTLAPVVALAAAAFTAYTFFGFILIPNYDRYDGNNEQYYPLFVAVLALSLALTAVSWSALSRAILPMPSAGLRKAVAAILLLVAILFALTWSGQIAAVAGGDYSTEYVEHPIAFWLIRTLDFAILIPASIATAVGLLRCSQTAVRAAYGLTGFVTLMVASIASMAIVLVARDDPSAEPAFLGALIPITSGLGYLTFRLWRSCLTGAGESGQADGPGASVVAARAARQS